MIVYYKRYLDTCSCSVYRLFAFLPFINVKDLVHLVILLIFEYVICTEFVLSNSAECFPTV